jgi:ureidoacrylate peracid hydrolase
MGLMEQVVACLREKTVVLTIDMQNEFLHEEGGFAKRGQDPKPLQKIVPTLVNFLEKVRSISSVKIIHTIMTEDEWTTPKCWRDDPNPVLVKGTWGTEFYGIKPLASELILPKFWYGAFSGSNLNSILQNLDIKTLIISGVLTNVCVDTTAREAFQNNYNVIVLSDCTAAYTSEEHFAALQNICKYFGYVVTSKDVLSVWCGN